MNRNELKLKGRRLVLRPIQEQDLDMIWHRSNDPGLRRLTGTMRTFEREDLDKWFARIVNDKSRIDLAIDLLTGEKCIGDLALLSINHDDRNASTRIAIDEKHTGKGYGKEAMHLLVQYAFNELKLHRIGLDVLEFNTRAIRAYEGIGFRHEGVLRGNYFDGEKFHGTVMMGLLEKEYERGVSDTILCSKKTGI